MRDEHVRKILESAPLARLSERELETVRAHAATCDDCARAFAASSVAAALLKAHASETVEPTPFFQTRVLAALRRERRAAEETPTLLRLWRAAGALASSMAAAVALLAAFTFFQPSTGANEVAATASDPYAAEAVLAREEAPDADVDVFATVYESDEAGGDDGQNR